MQKADEHGAVWHRRNVRHRTAWSGERLDKRGETLGADAHTSDTDTSLSGVQHLHYCTSMQSGGVHHVATFAPIGTAPIAATPTFRFRRAKLPFGSRP